MQPLYNIGETVSCPDGSGEIVHFRIVQGTVFYRLQLSDGYYTDPDDGSRRYDSNLIDFTDYWPESSLSPYRLRWNETWRFLS